MGTGDADGRDGRGCGGCGACGVAGRIEGRGDGRARRTGRGRCSRGDAADEAEGMWQTGGRVVRGRAGTAVGTE
ncbi:hypothetical protein GCM10010524_19960 [Streptomyces mexicanus]